MLISKDRKRSAVALNVSLVYFVNFYSVYFHMSIEMLIDMTQLKKKFVKNFVKYKTRNFQIKIVNSFGNLKSDFLTNSL